ncbi:hypothetical protein FT643_05265 [Ketobacter sp. MCCC 1A13808]|uniref:hypothetical protein n=1 Tax=Ketobacter sp. MCCC 1A13808 TaxID=2602738 RepID=UPI000F1534C5|nr:hypothetical protein [Ketobacter sp. MCCC 1A13808]MVF11549.1 hypothetical protein [Ketobacter sp. MCCC 1A13808]RLP53251.1 MAG: hypothetical protein D6160_16505 [Ketobacter sp.]
MAYITIEGEKYEKELIDLAKQLISGRGDGRISQDEVSQLITSAKDGVEVTDTEKKTLQYIRGNFKFTDAAASEFDAEVAKL